MNEATQVAQHDVRGLHDLWRYVELGGRPDFPNEERIRKAAAHPNDRSLVFLNMGRAALAGNAFAIWWLHAYPPQPGEAIRGIQRTSLHLVLGVGAGIAAYKYVLQWLGYEENYVPVVSVIVVVPALLVGLATYWIAPAPSDAGAYIVEPFVEIWRLRRLMWKVSRPTAVAGAVGSQALFSIQQTLGELEQAHAAARMPKAESGVHGDAKTASEREADRLAKGL
jgi:hypothetical protein